MDRRIAYSCPFVPVEWIAAHGLIPWRILPGNESEGMLEQRQGVCPYCRSFINTVLAHSDKMGIVLATTCDQMRRIFDVVRQIRGGETFLLNVPSTWQNETALNIYADEILRLGKWLCQRGGVRPSNEKLTETMKNYQQQRKFLLDNRMNMSCAKFSRNVAELYNETEQMPQYDKESLDGAGLALIGGPLMRDDFALLEMIESLGGRIVLDATETGERGLCDEFDNIKLQADPFNELVRAYFDGITDAWRRPNDVLFKWFAEQCKMRSVKGIILKRYVWCDIWHGLLYQLRDRFDVPVLEMDTGEISVLAENRIMGRIEAFLEAVL